MGGKWPGGAERKRGPREGSEGGPWRLEKRREKFNFRIRLDYSTILRDPIAPIKENHRYARRVSSLASCLPKAATSSLSRCRITFGPSSEP